MKVFKFGGGILNSAEAVRHIPRVLDLFKEEPLIIVVSAFGKTTNALEEIISAGFHETGETDDLLQNLQAYHDQIMAGLFAGISHPVYTETSGLWNKLEETISSEPKDNFSRFYDQVICYGELISSTITSHYLRDAGYGNTWHDVRRILKTDSNFRQAGIEWQQSRVNARNELGTMFASPDKSQMAVIQGFIGSDSDGRSTSLGREGSDYTASVFANLLDASEVITWKDVPGILNADPRHFRQTIKLDQISYAEATELAYYGAKVIHPKTVKPLQNKGIPLQVRSFLDPSLPGTLIHATAETDSSIPSFIFKFQQVLISVSTRDLSFIDEKVFKDVFSLLSKHFIHLNIIQNSALTLSFCVDDHPALARFIENLAELYSVRYNEGLELITIRHYNDKAAELVLQGREVLLEQQNRTVVQYVVR